MKAVSFGLAVAALYAVFVACAAGESCSPRSDDVSPPFEKVECYVTKEFKLHCHVSFTNDPSWTKNALLVVDFGYMTVLPQRIKLPEYSADAETVDVDAENELEMSGTGLLMSLPPSVTLKLFAEDGRTTVHEVHSWVGMFNEALVPDTTKLDTRDVLLIGMRGAGKSSLANSLVHVHYRYRPRKFVVWRPVGEPFVYCLTMHPFLY